MKFIKKFIIEKKCLHYELFATSIKTFELLLKIIGNKNDEEFNDWFNENISSFSKLSFHKNFKDFNFKSLINICCETSSFNFSFYENLNIILEKLLIKKRNKKKKLMKK
jgi:hypothetical protein